MFQKLLRFCYFYEPAGCKIYEISSYKRVNLTFNSRCKMAKRLVPDPCRKTISQIYRLM